MTCAGIWGLLSLSCMADDGAFGRKENVVYSLPISILVGVFSTEHESAREDRFSSWLPMEPETGLQFIFVHGASGARSSARWTVNLDIPENMNKGKSPAWFRWAAIHSYADYVFKMDLDTAVCPSGVVDIVREAHLMGADYIGHIHNFTSCGAYAHCPRPGGSWTYMSGAFYGLSRRAYTHLHAGGSDYGYEDIVMGKKVWKDHTFVQMFDIACMYKRGPTGINGAPLPGCAIQHMQDNKYAASNGTICTK